MITDLENPFWNHGSTGKKPPNGLDKSGGEQYEAPYYDFLADQQYKNTESINESISRRTIHLHGDRVLDGLDVRHDGGRSLRVTASSGAYVNGQFTGSIPVNSIVLSSNNSNRDRTDSIYVTANGSVALKQGQTTVPETTYKIAEVTLSQNNVIQSIADIAQQRTHSGTAQNRPSQAHDGDTLYNKGGSGSSRGNEATYEVYENGQGWQPLLFADGRQPRTDHQYYGGNNIYNVGNIYDETGDSLTDKFVNVSGDTMTGQLTMDNEWIAGVKNPISPQHAVNLRYLQNNYPTNGEANDRYVNESGDTMTGSLIITEGNNTGMNIGTASNGRPYIAPYKNGDNKFGEEFTFKNNEWTFEGRTRFQNGAILNNSQANKLSLNQLHALNTGSNRIRVMDQTQFDGGSVYWSNMNGDANDSYDAVWTNEPSGKDFRIHMRQNPKDSRLQQHYGMLFSTNGGHDGPIIACNVDNGITHVEELRSTRDELSGTPLARGAFGNKSNIGEIYYDTGAGEFRGKIAGGQIVRIGDPI